MVNLKIVIQIGSLLDVLFNKLLSPFTNNKLYKLFEVLNADSSFLANVYAPSTLLQSIIQSIQMKFVARKSVFLSLELSL